MKKAIGLVIDGDEAKVAHLGLENGKIFVLGLQTETLPTPLEERFDQEQPEEGAKGDEKDIFGIKKGAASKEKRSKTNMEVLFNLLHPYVQKKEKVALNMPISMSNYQRLDVIQEENEQTKEWKRKLRESRAGYRVLNGADDTLISLTYEQNPRSLQVLQDVNELLTGKLRFGLMEPTEVALVNFMRTRESIPPAAISLLVHIEDQFTRLIFLKGRELLHVSALIHENVMSPQLLEIVVKRILYEQDETSIGALTSVFLSGRASRLEALPYFIEQFPESEVTYLHSDATGPMPVGDDMRATSSEYAAAIALAWRQLTPRDPMFITMDLLSQEVHDRQDFLRINQLGYAIIAATLIMSFGLTWQIMNTRKQISREMRKGSRINQTMDQSKEQIDLVLDIEEETKATRNSLKLADSLSAGHDEFLQFLRTLNRVVAQTGEIWISELSKSGDDYALQGRSSSRDRITLLAARLGGASLKRVTREADNRKSYEFELDQIRHTDFYDSTAARKAFESVERLPITAEQLFRNEWFDPGTRLRLAREHRLAREQARKTKNLGANAGRLNKSLVQLRTRPPMKLPGQEEQRTDKPENDRVIKTGSLLAQNGLTKSEPKPRMVEEPSRRRPETKPSSQRVAPANKPAPKRELLAAKGGASIPEPERTSAPAKRPTSSVKKPETSGKKLESAPLPNAKRPAARNTKKEVPARRITRTAEPKVANKRPRRRLLTDATPPVKNGRSTPKPESKPAVKKPAVANSATKSGSKSASLPNRTKTTRPAATKSEAPSRTSQPRTTPAAGTRTRDTRNTIQPSVRTADRGKSAATPKQQKERSPFVNWDRRDNSKETQKPDGRTSGRSRSLPALDPRTPATRTAATEKRPASPPATAKPGASNGELSRSARPPATSTTRTASSTKPAAQRTADGYGVEIHNTSSRASADAAAERCRVKGHPATVIPYLDAATRTDRFRVVVGSFRTRTQARSAARRLANELGDVMTHNKVVQR